MSPRIGPDVVRQTPVRHNVPMARPDSTPEVAPQPGVALGPWSASVTPVPPLRSAEPTLRFLLYSGFFTGACAGVLCLIVLGVGRAFGVHLIEPQGVPAWVQAFPWLVVVLVPIACGLVGALGTAVVRGWAHARAWVWIVGTGLAVLSLGGPLAESMWSARLMLASMHVITWFLVVPQLARIAGDSEPRASVERRI